MPHAVRAVVVALLTLLTLTVCSAHAVAQSDGGDAGWGEAPAEDWGGDDSADGAWDEPPAEDVEEPVEDITGNAPWHEPRIPVQDALPLVKGRTVSGKVARMRADGTAAVPRSAPKKARTLIRAINEIIGKPYKWGGGHARVYDNGYDCSGAVSYGLIRAGLLASPQVSGTLARYGARGAGRWVTVYAHADHVYLEVAGLRLDTSSAGDPAGTKGVRWRPVTGKRRGFSVRHPLGL